MRKKFFGLMLASGVVLLLQSGHIQDLPMVSIFVDNDSVQEHGGKIGKWVITDRKKLSDYISEYDADASDVSIKKINNRTVYAFIPYGESYKKFLKARGVFRSIVSVSPDICIWPLADAIRISSLYGSRSRGYHPGIDIPAEKGSVVRAAMDGEVVFSGYFGGYGYMIDIEHNDNFKTRYGHNLVNLVEKGDSVHKGQAIALVGSTGLSTGYHVHYEVRLNEVPLDPIDYLPVFIDRHRFGNEKNGKQKRLK